MIEKLTVVVVPMGRNIYRMIDQYEAIDLALAKVLARFLRQRPRPRYAIDKRRCFASADSLITIRATRDGTMELRKQQIFTRPEIPGTVTSTSRH